MVRLLKDKYICIKLVNWISKKKIPKNRWECLKINYRLIFLGLPMSFESWSMESISPSSGRSSSLSTSTPTSGSIFVSIFMEFSWSKKLNAEINNCQLCAEWKIYFFCNIPVLPITQHINVVPVNFLWFYTHISSIKYQ